MNSAIGSLVKKAREKKGLTQTKAGKLLKISEQFIGRVEAGEVPLPLSRANKVRQVLRITRAQLISAYLRDYSKKVEDTIYNKKG